MAMTNSERQAKYRKERPFSNGGAGEKRLNTVVSSRAAFALERLAVHYCVTKREMLERLINQADEAVYATLELDSPEWERYQAASKQAGVTA